MKNFSSQKIKFPGISPKSLQKEAFSNVSMQKGEGFGSNCNYPTWIVEVIVFGTYPAMRRFKCKQNQEMSSSLDEL